MSYVEIFVIEADGQVASFDRVHNPHGWFPAVWDYAAEKHGIGKRFHLHEAEHRAVWNLFRDGRLTPTERLMMGATFDRVWIRRARCAELADALDVFHDFLMTREPDCAPTARSMAVIIRRALAEKPDLMGVCFNGTSVSQVLWNAPPEPAEEDSAGLINILKQPLCYDGKPHWEIDA